MAFVPFDPSTLSATKEAAITDVPFVDWDTFINHRFIWKQGEHIGLIGPTNCGKTTLAEAILPLRKYIVVLATKPRDKSLDRFGKANGFEKITEWKTISPNRMPRRLLWPYAKDLNAVNVQHKVFANALVQIYREGGWCVYMDELWFMIHHLKFEFAIKTYLQQARSLDISLVVATQRPAFVPLEVYDQSTHLFFWRDNDERNLKRISGISWLSANLVRSVVSRLEPHEVLYINTRDGLLIRTKSPAPK